MFCIKCARVHEVQDGSVSSCAFIPCAMTPQTHAYHMLHGSGMPVKLSHPVSLGVDPRTYGEKSAVKKKGCCVCPSVSVACRVEVMVRRCEQEIGCPITYCIETRSFCSKHAPPRNLVLADRFIDERQVMEFAFLKATGTSAASCRHRRV